MPHRTAPDTEPFDLASFGLHEMLRCGAELRRTAKDATSVESAARAMVRYLHGAMREPGTGQPACALVRFFVTHPYARLGPRLQAVAQSGLAIPPRAETRCLTLLASDGVEAAWRSRRTSSGHQAIPLASAAMVRSAPMIAALLGAFGLEIETLVAPATGSPVTPGGAGKTYNVFHVADAVDSPYIPAQSTFVVPYGVTSVLGFGAALATGEVAAIILFSRARIPEATAARFRNIALDMKACLFAFGADQVFDAGGADAS